MSNQPQSSEVAWKYLSGTTDLAGPGTPEYVDVGEEQQLYQKMIMMKMRMTMTTEVRGSISCPLVATEPVITKGQRKLREVVRPILHTLC